MTKSSSAQFEFEKQDLVCGQKKSLNSASEEVLVYVYLPVGEVQLVINQDCQLIKSKEYTFLYLKEQELAFLETILPSQIFLVHFPPVLLLGRLTKVCCYIERIQDCVALKESCFLVDEPLKCNPSTLQIFSDVQSVWNKSEFQTFFLDACGLKLIGLFLEHQDRLNEECGHMKQVDIDKMHDVRLLIEKNIQNPLLISELAKEVGTNVAYLKQQFKNTFGTTVYGYTLQYRMELSKNLLNNSDYTISDVAYQVGYKHATHFSQAFKKFYGYLPNSIKRAYVIIYCMDFFSAMSYACI